MNRVCGAVAVLAFALPPAGADDAADRAAKELATARREVELLRRENAELAAALKKATAELEAAKHKAAAARQQAEALRDLLKDESGKPGIPLGKVPVPPVFPDDGGVRGTVTVYRDGLIQMSIGIDAGLKVGTVLDVYRAEGGGKYLGTVTVATVHPKTAVGTFRPVDPTRPLARLKPDELPKTGDTVANLGGVGKRAAAPDGRGKVTAVRGGDVHLNLGTDAGVTVGTRLEVYDRGGKYLGTVTLNAVAAADSAGWFLPAGAARRGVFGPALGELPAAGDSVVVESIPPLPFGGFGRERVFERDPAPAERVQRVFAPVAEYKNGVVRLAAGSEAGVAEGAVLHVVRLGPPAKYLGTVVVGTVSATGAVGAFKPADPRKAVADLAADEVPAAGDEMWLRGK